MFRSGCLSPHMVTRIVGTYFTQRTFPTRLTQYDILLQMRNDLLMASSSLTPLQRRLSVTCSKPVPSCVS